MLSIQHFLWWPQHCRPLCCMAYPNHASFCLLTVVKRDSCGPSSKLILLLTPMVKEEAVLSLFGRRFRNWFLVGPRGGMGNWLWKWSIITFNIEIMNVWYLRVFFGGGGGLVLMHWNVVVCVLGMVSIKLAHRMDRLEFKKKKKKREKKGYFVQP